MDDPPRSALDPSDDVPLYAGLASDNSEKSLLESAHLVTAPIEPLTPPIGAVMDVRSVTSLAATLAGYHWESDLSQKRRRGWLEVRLTSAQRVDATSDDRGSRRVRSGCISVAVGVLRSHCAFSC